MSILLSVSWCFEPTKDYSRAENKLQSISKLFIPQVVISHVPFFKQQLRFYPQFRNANREKQQHMFRGLFISSGTSRREPASIICNEEPGDLFYSAGSQGTGVNHSQHMKTSGDVSGKTNAGEWIGRVEIAKEEISGSKRSMNGHILTYSNF